MHCRVTLLIFCYLAYNAFGDNSNSNCNCVPYYECSDDSGNVITDGLDLFDLRAFKGNTCSGYFDVCCNAFKSFIEEIPTEKRNRPKGCGYHESESFPWTASLYYQTSAELNSTQKCGASLIHPQVAVTAAHCLIYLNPTIWTVRISKLQRSVKKIKIHEDYNSATLQNDLALLILNDPVSISDKVNVICIPSSPTSVFDKTLCTLASWNNEHKKLIELPIVSRETCVNLYRINSGLGVFFRLHESFICAGGEANKDACVGDGGSPLVCPIANRPGRYQQVGIVTWGVGCGEFNLPGVYVNLGLFREWIDEFMIQNKLDANVYKYQD